jgi:glucosylceramidase
MYAQYLVRYVHVRRGAFRIDSTNNGTVRNVAFVNPDGAEALIAHNGGTGAQSIRVVWAGQSFTYTLPARTSATFTWQNNVGTPTTPPPGGGTATPPPGGGTGQITGLAADGTRLQIWACSGGANQKWVAPA